MDDMAYTMIWAQLTYKVLGLLSGFGCAFLGYLLFVAGIWKDAGTLSGKYKDNELLLKGAAPGSFFALVGAFVMIAVVVKGLSFQIPGTSSNNNATNPGSPITPPATSFQSSASHTPLHLPPVDLGSFSGLIVQDSSNASPDDLYVLGGIVGSNNAYPLQFTEYGSASAFRSSFEASGVWSLDIPPTLGESDDVVIVPVDDDSLDEENSTGKDDNSEGKL